MSGILSDDEENKIYEKIKKELEKLPDGKNGGDKSKK